jgi:hypothetical protein
VRQLLAILTLVSVLFISACTPPQESDNDNTVHIPLRSFDVKTGTKFTHLPSNPFSAPTLEQIPITIPKHAENVDAIWGASGRDDEGNIYFGVSTHGISKKLGNDSRTAYLYQYNPVTEETLLQSDVITELKRAGLYREGMGQNKLHSKIYQANDGYLYFSSFDEAGEDEGINPTWGGHLWRKRPHLLQWEHVLSTAEALIAVNTNGRYVYTLGYWDHVLYQYDTKTSQIKRLVVGSVSTHISRNFIVDENGHVYVPFLKENDYNEIEAYLNEYNPDLRLINSYPMPSYQAKKIKHHHGIIGYTSMVNGDIYFTTAEGGLYQLLITKVADKKLVYKGDMYDNGNTDTYIPSLFSYSGTDFVLGVSRIKNLGFNWIIHDVNTGTALITKIDTMKLSIINTFGTLTKDETGDFYIVGNQKIKGISGYQPLLLKMHVAP